MPYAFSVGEARVVRCLECDFLFLNPQPSNAILAEIYSQDYFLGATDAGMREHVALLKTATAAAYLDELARQGVAPGRLLEVGCGDGYLLRAAEARGYDVVGVDLSGAAAERARAGLARGRVLVGELPNVDLPDGSFDVAVLADVIEHAHDPRLLLESVWRRLKPGGLLLIATPATDSWSARLLGSQWMEFKVEHLSYFSRPSLRSVLWQTGFQAVRIGPGLKTVSLRYVAGHFERYPIWFWGTLVRWGHRLLPRRWRDRPISLVGSGMLAVAVKGELRSRPLLSIIVPAYNEGETVSVVLDALAAKSFAGLDKEIIVVESNSTDDTRERVRRYEAHPDFRIILEDRPRGKGAATRAGLAAARGDFVLIQDADLEYDFEDYESLLEPLVAGREAFVLGARHGGRGWKMRRFNDQPLHALLLNCAHWGFTLMINVSLGIWLRDPFTMFKVFRRDCVHGLSFECNRFDFDWELLIKLVRRGYRPIEIPVNYRSRSFKEGKKITLFRDPLTWVWALLKSRFVRL